VGSPTGTPAGDPTAAAPSIPQSNTPNVQPIAVGASPSQTRNMLTTSVTVCTPGSASCVTIDSIQVDTGSQGLRILASALPAGLALPAVTAGSGGAAVTGECGVFGTGYTWGAVRTADIRMAGQLAAAVPIQVIADPALPTVPADCTRSGQPMMSASTLRVNGILGVGLFAADCGSGCVTSALPRWYYACDSTGACSPSTQPLALQVTNPVSRFATDNNGIVIDLPAVADAGAPQVSGQLIFGIGTQANNTLGSATVLKANTQTGYVITSMNGQSYSQSFIDSGSNGLFFPSTTLAQCGFWYCPPSAQTSTATLSGTNGATATLSFSVANAQSLFATANNAFDNLAGPSSTVFDWGLPFFFGRRIYTAIESRATSAGNGPYYAF
ncbi:MAG TPA: DUF3443 domain-containing protein, partial [Paraburkholderia sp.]